MSIAFLSDAISAIRSASAAESCVGSGAAHEVRLLGAPAPYSPLGDDVVGHPVGHQVADRLPCRTRRRISDDDTWISGMSR